MARVHKTKSGIGLSRQGLRPTEISNQPTSANCSHLCRQGPETTCGRQVPPRRPQLLRHFLRGGGPFHHGSASTKACFSSLLYPEQVFFPHPSAPNSFSGVCSFRGAARFGLRSSFIAEKRKGLSDVLAQASSPEHLRRAFVCLPTASYLGRSRRVLPVSLHFPSLCLLPIPSSHSIYM